MDFLLSTGNQHKAEEFSVLFDEKILKINSAPEKIDVVEDGLSFRENALLKAKAYFEKYKVPTLSDDSGLVVEALDGELGIHTARFGGEGLSDKERAFHLLERMKEIDSDKRQAYFVCVLCFYISDEQIYFFEGRVTGKIGTEYRGEDGFGYDPVFIPEKYDGASTMAMIPDWKNKHSHRAVACAEAEHFFRQRNCQNQ